MSEEQTVINELVTRAGITEEELLKKIKEKEDEFSGLVSRLGAIYIVGKELGVDLIKPKDKELKIENILPEMQNVNFYGKVMNLSPIHEFNTKTGKGVVSNITLSDETGSIRISLWNEDTKKIEGINIGEVIEMSNGYTTMDNLGNAEVRLGRLGKIKKIKKEIKVTQTKTRKSVSVKQELKGLNEGEQVNIRGVLVQVYERPLLYLFCQECKSKIDGQSCEKHKKAELEKILVLSGVIDDGYGSINAVFFRDNVKDLLGMTIEEIEKGIKKQGDVSFVKSLNLIGKEFKINGFIRKNKVLNSLELQVQNIEEIKVKEEINRLLNDVGKV